MGLLEKLLGRNSSSITAAGPNDTRDNGFKAAYDRGNALYYQGDFSGAVTEYRRAVRLKRKDPEARNNLGNTLFRLGDLDAAITEFRELIRIAPEFADAHNNLGNVLLENGSWNGARLEYEKAIQLDPNNADAHYNLGNLLKDNKPQVQDAIREYEQAIKLRPDFWEAHFNLANVLAGKGELDAAVPEYEAALRQKRGDAKITENLQKVSELVAIEGELLDLGSGSNSRSWLRPEYQTKCRQRAQLSLREHDEQLAITLANMYRAYDRASGRKTDEEKLQCERITSEAADLGTAICDAAGAAKMLLIAFRAAEHGARLRTIELFWDGICGWKY